MQYQQALTSSTVVKMPLHKYEHTITVLLLYSVSITQLVSDSQNISRTLWTSELLAKLWLATSQKQPQTAC